MATPIDPSAGVTGAITSIEGAVNDNLGALGAVGGALIAVGLVWKLVRKFARP